MANFFKVNTKKSAKTKADTVLTVEVKKLDLNGCGVAYYQKKPVFIKGSLPNENVDIKLIDQKNKYVIAKLLAVNKASIDRVTPVCQHFSLCGGCDLQHLDYSQQLSFKKNKVIELFYRAGFSGVTIESLPWQSPIVSEQWHYRRKARIGVQFDKNAQATIGFRQKSTNQLAAIKSCPVLVEPAELIFVPLKKLLNELSVKKSIGHIEVICTETTKNNEALGQVTLIVRQIRAQNKHDHMLWQTYADTHQWQVYFQNNDGDVTSFKKLPTDDDLHYSLLDNIKINFSFSDFIQINQQANLAMVKQALAWLTPKKNDLVLDLFCGLGNFSLPLAKKVNRVVGVEGVQNMVNKAYANAAVNNIHNCQFFQADLNSEWLSQTWAKINFTKVLLDPARAGAELAIKQIIELNIATILYVSCEPTTLARDSQLLLEHGYKIKKIGLIDMFGQTKHVETMVLFSR